MAVGSGARVYVLDRSVDVLRKIEAEFGARAVTVHSSRDTVEQHVLSADLVIGAVLVPGAAAPGTSTAPITRSAESTCCSTVSRLEWTVTARAPNSASIFLRTSTERSSTY